MQTIWQDLRYDERMLLKKPGITLIAALTLGIVAYAGTNPPLISFQMRQNLRPTIPKQEQRQPQDMKIDSDGRTQIINETIARVNDLYVFPDMAKKIEEAIREKAKQGEYDKIESGRELARTLTGHLQAISHDKHFELRFSAGALPDPLPQIGESAADQEFFRFQNYGFERVERLAGNVGYIKMTGFYPPRIAGATASGVMQAVAGTDALIIDLRSSGGGWPEMVAYLRSYFVGAEPVRLSEIHWRSGRVEQTATLRDIPGPRYLDRPLFILTSRNTGSAAEEFSYDLQALGKATIVGETTAGAANPSLPVRLADHFLLIVPQGHVRNVVTRTNWEGVGVIPQVATPSIDALATAHRSALRRLIEKTTDPVIASRRRAALESIK